MTNVDESSREASFEKETKLHDGRASVSMWKEGARKEQPADASVEDDVKTMQVGLFSM